jgi:hypothetical protein
LQTKESHCYLNCLNNVELFGCFVFSQTTKFTVPLTTVTAVATAVITGTAVATVTTVAVITVTTTVTTVTIVTTVSNVFL